MINGVPCVKFNKGVALDELICKANNKVYIPKVAPISDKINKMKQLEAPKPQAPLPRCYASDYMCCWGKDGKIVVKYVGAQKRRTCSHHFNLVMTNVETLCLVTMEKEKFLVWVKLLSQMIILFPIFY